MDHEHTTLKYPTEHNYAKRSQRALIKVGSDVKNGRKQKSYSTSSINPV